MKEFWLRYPLQSSKLTGALDLKALHQASIEQAAWADDKGFARLYFAEHHGVPINYLSSPIAYAFAFAARTKNLRLNALCLLPYHDPVRIAEETLLLDIVSNGRAELSVGLGYAPSEMEMFRVDPKDRGPIVEDKLTVLRRAMQGEQFEHNGRPVYVTPAAVQKPNPPIYVCGTLKVSARRAIEFGDGFAPISPGLQDYYIQECEARGKTPGPVIDGVGANGIYVTDDPEKGWAEVGPYFLAQQHAYLDWTTNGTYAQKDVQPGASGVYGDFLRKRFENVDELRASNTFHVYTPAQCIAHAREQFRLKRHVEIEPLVCGLPEKLSWPSLELIASKVIPFV